MSHFTVTVRGKMSEWSVRVPPEQAAAMREDGFEVHEIVNTIPEWVVNVGLQRIWCAAQDIWNWPSTWGRK